MEVDLLLARPRLALGALDLDAGLLHPLPDRADEWFVVAGREHVVVEDVWDGWREVRVVLRVCFGKRLFEQIELQLGAEHGLKAQGPRPFDLGPQHLAW